MREINTHVAGEPDIAPLLARAAHGKPDIELATPFLRYAAVAAANDARKPQSTSLFETNLATLPIEDRLMAYANNARGNPFAGIIDDGLVAPEMHGAMSADGQANIILKKKRAKRSWQEFFQDMIRRAAAFIELSSELSELKDYVNKRIDLLDDHIHTLEHLANGHGSMHAQFKNNAKIKQALHQARTERDTLKDIRDNDIADMEADIDDVNSGQTQLDDNMMSKMKSKLAKTSADVGSAIWSGTKTSARALAQGVRWACEKIHESGIIDEIGNTLRRAFG